MSPKCCNPQVGNGWFRGPFAAFKISAQGSRLSSSSGRGGLVSVLCSWTCIKEQVQQERETWLASSLLASDLESTLDEGEGELEGLTCCLMLGDQKEKRGQVRLMLKSPS